MVTICSCSPPSPVLSLHLGWDRETYIMAPTAMTYWPSTFKDVDVMLESHLVLLLGSHSVKLMKNSSNEVCHLKGLGSWMGCLFVFLFPLATVLPLLVSCFTQRGLLYNMPAKSIWTRKRDYFSPVLLQGNLLTELSPFWYCIDFLLNCSLSLACIQHISY